MTDLISRQAAIDAVRNYLLECQIEDGDYHADGIMYELDCLPSVQPEQKNERIFQEIVVEYPSISTYPECEGKPYFSIKYTEDRQDFIGYGTYKPDVLSEYLKKDFMPSAQPEITKRTAETEQNVPNDELISRKAAIETVHSMYKRCDTGDITDYRDMMHESIIVLPSVQPEIIRCGQCKYAEVADPEDSQDGYTCQYHRGSIWFSGSFCSWAERQKE